MHAVQPELDMLPAENVPGAHCKQLEDPPAAEEPAGQIAQPEALAVPGFTTAPA